MYIFLTKAHFSFMFNCIDVIKTRARSLCSDLLQRRHQEYFVSECPKLGIKVQSCRFVKLTMPLDNSFQNRPWIIQRLLLLQNILCPCLFYIIRFLYWYMYLSYSSIITIIYHINSYLYDKCELCECLILLYTGLKQFL